MCDNKKNKIDILDVANYLIQNQNKNDYTKMKLQKMSFLIYVKYLVDTKEKLFKNIWEAWPYGPVSIDLYLASQTYQRAIKPRTTLMPIKRNKKYDDTIFTNKQKEVMDYVIENYGLKKAWELVEITHKNHGPWSDSYVHNDLTKNKISDEKIIKFYSVAPNIV
ncbi:Panacea domain-containing protein [Candidatus Phytoplasma pruni]|uniref:DUF4065 domain-containing protein n=1 Tax=Candidatus Phytoplasma pruni TaxID=479893 RepID=A0A851HCK6_9MOLU|nr:type II toxin-antitoxin system antitoxin SocA domain-containing protein [Candidatus Phytoplasma pruni]NWN45791.1 DUF4065 domain-containing protein [Candidatus Phytoplasma pruni]